MNTLIKIGVAALILAASSGAAADADYHCTYVQAFGDPVGNVEQYKLDDCKKGDVVHIIIYHEDNADMEARFVGIEIAEICDNTLPITILGPGRAVCTYRGSRRKIRLPD